MLEKTGSMTSMDNSQTNTLNSIIENIQSQALSIKHTNILPTVKTVSEGQLVVYDDDAGTKRLYVVTQKKNLGYVTLT